MALTDAGRDTPARSSQLEDRPRSGREHHWAHRRFVATKQIDDAEAVATLAPAAISLSREKVFRRLLAVADAGAALTAIAVTTGLWGASRTWLFLFVPLAAVFFAKVIGLYDHDDMVLHKSTLGEWRPLLRSSMMTAGFAYLLWRISPNPHAGRGLRLYLVLSLGTFALTLFARAVARRTARKATPAERCLIVGAADTCGALASRLDELPGVALIGTVPDDDVDCSVAGVYELVERLGVERLVVIPHAEWGERGSLKLIQSAKWLGIRVTLVPTVMNVVGASAAIDTIDTMVLMGVPRFGLSRSSMALKRSLDLGIGGVALLLTGPLMAIIAVAIRLDTPGPALFRQRRVGRDGQTFTIFKFRSMVVDAERRRPELENHNETVGVFKMTDDPRITKVGMFLRRAYLDELPQLLNVMRGDMSLVGPRPLIESEDAQLQGYDRHRSRLTPGMTGPWQLQGPLNASLAELAKLDYMYASNWNVWADIDIMLGTATRILGRHGR
jgi:exopolysaccharide biosynthesis polyprenyl glycosylphosphotransferase